MTDDDADLTPFLKNRNGCLKRINRSVRSPVLQAQNALSRRGRGQWHISERSNVPNFQRMLDTHVRLPVTLILLFVAYS